MVPNQHLMKYSKPSFKDHSQIKTISLLRPHFQRTVSHYSFVFQITNDTIQILRPVVFILSCCLIVKVLLWYVLMTWCNFKSVCLYNKQDFISANCRLTHGVSSDVQKYKHAHICPNSCKWPQHRVLSLSAPLLAGTSRINRWRWRSQKRDAIWKCLTEWKPKLTRTLCLLKTKSCRHG